MKQRTRLMFVTLLASFPLYAAQEAVAPMNPAQQKQVEQVVRNYIVKNPQVIVDSMQTLQQQQMEQAKQNFEKTEKAAPQYKTALFNQPTDPMAGNINGTVTIVDFFDYQCPHCAHMTPVLEALIGSYPNLRVVFKEFPIRGSLSEFAAKAALAAKNQNKYLEMHKALMQLANEQKLNEDNIIKAAASLGLNVSQLKSDMNSDGVKLQIKNNYQLAQNLKLIFTPAFFIASNSQPLAIKFIPGGAEQTQFKAILDKMDH